MKVLGAASNASDAYLLAQYKWIRCRGVVFSIFHFRTFSLLLLCQWQQPTRFHCIFNTLHVDSPPVGRSGMAVHGLSLIAYRLLVSKRWKIEF